MPIRKIHLNGNERGEITLLAKLNPVRSLKGDDRIIRQNERLPERTRCKCKQPLQ